MMDILDTKTRSRMMSSIRSSNTKPEILTRKALHSLGYRFRLDSKIDKIKPDIVLRKYLVAIFVHGCYWHQHDSCKLAYSDRNYSEKWVKKFKDNKQRDRRVNKELIMNGWRIAIIWECQTRNIHEFKKTIIDIDHFIKEDNAQFYESVYRSS